MAMKYSGLILLFASVAAIAGCGLQTDALIVKEQYVNIRGMPETILVNPNNGLTGIFRIYRKSDGTKFYEGSYTNGKRNGLSSWYNCDGSYYEQCVYRNGLPWMGTPLDQAKEDIEVEEYYVNGKNIKTLQYEEDDQDEKQTKE